MIDYLQEAADLLLQGVARLRDAGESEMAELLEAGILESFDCRKCCGCGDVFDFEDVTICRACQQAVCNSCMKKGEPCVCMVNETVRPLLS